MPLERIQARLLSRQSGQRLGLALPGGLHALQRGLRRLIDPTQARPTRTLRTSCTEGCNPFIPKRSSWPFSSFRASTACAVS